MRIEDVSDRQISEAPACGYHMPAKELEIRLGVRDLSANYQFKGNFPGKVIQEQTHLHPFMEAVNAERYAGIRGLWHFLKHDPDKLKDMGMSGEAIEHRLKMLEKSATFERIGEQIDHPLVAKLAVSPDNPYRLKKKPTHAEISELQDDYYKELRKRWSQTVELNPELRKLDFDANNMGALLNVFDGVTSQLKADDIQFYIDGKQSSEAMVALKREYLGKDFDAGWIMSDKTALRLIKQLDPNVIETKEFRDAVSQTKVGVGIKS